MKSESKNSLKPSSLSSSLLPPQAPAQSFIGWFVNFISVDNLRYQGNIYRLNHRESKIGLRNVIWHGTEERNQKGFRILPSNFVHPFIVFDKDYIKEILLTHPKGFGIYGNAFLARESKPCNAMRNQPIPLIGSSSYNPQATSHSDSSSVKRSSVKDLAQPQFSGSSQSLFITFLPAPISLGQNSGAFDLEAMYPNLKQYKLWDVPEREEEKAEPIARLYNPYGPIEKPVKHTKEIGYGSRRR